MLGKQGLKKEVRQVHRKLKTVLLAALCLLLALPTPVSAASASIKLNISKKTLTVGSSVKLKATVTGESRTVTWKSSNSAIATVSKSGKVTAKKAGKTTITAKANGKTAKCVVTVKKKSVTVDFNVGIGGGAFRNGSAYYIGNAGTVTPVYKNRKLTRYIALVQLSS